MTKSERKLVDQAIEGRKDWADRQQTWYAMRAGSIKRKSKPYPRAPDMRYPLGDTLVDKIKPLYLQQAYAGEHIFSLISLRQQDEAVTAGCEEWFDYQIKQRSNFERTLAVAVDQKCECGFTVIKPRWDASNKRLSFTNIDPLHFIVPSSSQELNEEGGADWCIHVLHMSEAEYRANPTFVQDDDLIKRMKGKGLPDDNSKMQEKEQREGINCSADENEIVLWEFYNRDRVAGTITVETVSPILGDDDNSVRTPFELPYNTGCFSSGEYFPFVKLRYEIKGKGWYDSRGVMEINAVFENGLSKDWNTILQWSDFFGNPLFQNNGSYQSPGANNYKTMPGSILPAGLVPVQPASPPEFLREDMNLLRALAEDRTQVPDLNASEHLTGNVPATQTATGINAVLAQSGQGANMKSRVYRMDLNELGKIAWSIIIQYVTAPNASQDLLEYVQDGQVSLVDIKNLTDKYSLTPNGSADNWNKSQLLAKRMALFQQWQATNFAYIDQGEATKWVMEADDPRLVKRLYKDPGQKAADQAEDQAFECLLIAAGTSPVVEQTDDDKTHLTILVQWVMDKLQRTEMTPEMAQLSLKHGSEHVQGLQVKKDPALSQIQQQLQPLVDMLMHVAQQPGPPPKNIVQMQQPGGNAANQTVPDQTNGSPAAAPSSRNQDKPSQVISALATAFKAGLPVTFADFSKAMTDAGLPPVEAGPVIQQPQPMIQTQQQGT